MGLAGKQKLQIVGVKCPICGSATSVRTVKKGKNTGKKFNVCVRYPECKGQVKVTIAQIDGIPEGTFRCDVCKFVYPAVCLCGTVIDKSGWDEYPFRKTSGTATTYTLCGICAVWLGFKDTRCPWIGSKHGLYPEGLCFFFSDEQHNKINTLHKELELNKVIDEMVRALALQGFTSEIDKQSQEKTLALPDKEYKELCGIISQTLNYKSIQHLRGTLLPKNIKELSDKITRGEDVDPDGISLINQNRIHIGPVKLYAYRGKKGEIKFINGY